jgi:hypothetical protein
METEFILLFKQLLEAKDKQITLAAEMRQVETYYRNELDRKDAIIVQLREELRLKTNFHNSSKLKKLNGNFLTDSVRIFLYFILINKGIIIP